MARMTPLLLHPLNDVRTFNSPAESEQCNLLEHRVTDPIRVEQCRSDSTEDSILATLQFADFAHL